MIDIKGCQLLPAQSSSKEHQYIIMNVKVRGVIACVFIIFMCCECSFANRVHWRRRRSHSSNHYGDDSQQCSTLFRDYSCKQEYIQTRATFYLSCNSYHARDSYSGSDLLSEYPCLQLRNGTFCEDLLDRYFDSESYYGSRYGYDPDSNRSCSYSECSQECSMILQQLKDTWGCCFHELANYFSGYRLSRFTVEYSSNYWRDCGIQPPEMCPYDISLTAIDPVVNECTNREQYGHLFVEYYCDFIPQYITEANSRSCTPQYSKEYCALKNGKYCYELMVFSNRTHNLYAKADEVCSSSRDICTLDCKTMLQSLSDHAGCCLTIINRTDPYDLSRPDILRYGLWNSCGIEPPGQCSSATQCKSFLMVISIVVFIILCFLY